MNRFVPVTFCDHVVYGLWCLMWIPFYILISPLILFAFLFPSQPSDELPRQPSNKLPYLPRRPCKVRGSEDSDPKGDSSSEDIASALADVSRRLEKIQKRVDAKKARE